MRSTYIGLIQDTENIKYYFEITVHHENLEELAIGIWKRINCSSISGEKVLVCHKQVYYLTLSSSCGPFCELLLVTKTLVQADLLVQKLRSRSLHCNTYAVWHCTKPKLKAPLVSKQPSPIFESQHFIPDICHFFYTGKIFGE